MIVMSTNSSVECPVRHVTINENSARIIALQVLVISLLYSITSWPLLIVFLLIDFFARGFGFNKFSLLSQIASGIVKLFAIAYNPIDEGPKLFAARLGIILCLLILVFHTGFPSIAIGFAIVFSLFSSLEAFVGFCAGCHIHAIGEKFFNSSVMRLREHD